MSHVSMTRRSLLLVLALVTAAPFQARATAESAAWAGSQTLISGTSRYDAGEWIYTDFVYDDYGADTVPAGQPNVVSLASTTGDFRYPNGTTAAGNAADIVEVRARIVDDVDVEVRVLLQSLVNVATPALRVEANGVEQIVSSANAVVDADANTITFTLAGAASQGQLALNIGAGLHDGNGGLRAGSPGYAQAAPGEFTTGAPTNARMFDLAFNTRELEGRGGAWNENVQSSALAAGNLSPFTQTLDMELLRARTTTPVPSPTGYSVRLFKSRQTLGEGMASSFPQYRGAWQPYAIWVPANYEPSTPAKLLLMLHSLSVHHNQYRGGSSPSASYKTFYEQIERVVGAIVVTPLGRGPDGWYEDQGLIDTLEVWADAREHYTIDDDRTIVGGYSMGGYGTYRLTTLMPDSFASAVSIVGPPANGIWAYPAAPTGGEANPDNTHPQLENTRHVPFWITQGVLDELVPFTGVARQAQRFAELGHEYRFALHPAEDHLTFVYKDEWSR
ncbi:MAG TPA: prolyl oligopeptidase family serine peptidase, partial [Actinomycetota bacterium]|nr:prolyl oligopeptidase family serine peptidase [Actinomycetota bacterium]